MDGDAVRVGFGGLRTKHRAVTLGVWRPFVGVVLGYWLLSELVGWIVGWTGPAWHGAIAVGAVAFSLVAVLVAGTVVGVTRGWSAGLTEMRAVAGRSVVIIGGAVLVTAVFTGWRVSIPAVHPYQWDVRLDHLDLAIHGTRPWRLTHAAFVRLPWLPAVIEWVYSTGWFLANIAVVLVLALSPIGRRGQRVLVAYALQYAVLGSIVAVWVSSVGPIFYGRLVGGVDPYASLHSALARWFRPDSPAGMFSYQTHLWTQYQAGNTGFTTGITAFPSIHVSSAVLLALGAWSWHRWAGVLGWALALLTLFGSVALGWHYAVDGYASIIGMLALWWVAGRLVAVQNP